MFSLSMEESSRVAVIKASRESIYFQRISWFVALVTDIKVSVSQCCAVIQSNEIPDSKVQLTIN